MTIRHLIFAGIGVWAASGVVRAADAPVALVLDYSGPANAKFSAYSELSDGAELSLGARDWLTILHYRSCKRTTITGAKVLVALPGLSVNGGSQNESAGLHCPQEVRAAASVEGVMAPRMDCIVVGGRQTAVGRAAIFEDGREVLSVPMQGHRLIAAPAAAELRIGGQYTLVIQGIRGAAIKTIPVTIEANAVGRTCLLRVD
ncbi:MAG: hypothetical protein WC722_16805 [Rhodospirillales bacterium]|jgi:hypothetical protein